MRTRGKKRAKVRQFSDMTKYFLKKNQKKCIFALFRWHFNQLGVHKLGNYAIEIRLQTVFFDFSEFTTYYFEVGRHSRVGALEIFIKKNAFFFILYTLFSKIYKIFRSQFAYIVNL